MAELLRKVFDCRIKSVDEQKHTVEAVVSTASVDRDHDIILPKAFTKHLDVYRSNPILCWGHPLGKGGVVPPELLIGRAEEIDVTHAGLWARWKYAVDENPMARMCFDLIAGGYLKAYSVGGLPLDWVTAADNPQRLAGLPSFARQGLKSGDVDVVITEMELLEVSNCFVGSNRDALARAADDGVVSLDLAFKAYGSMDITPSTVVLSRSFSVPFEQKEEELMTDSEFIDLVDELTEVEPEAALAILDLASHDVEGAKSALAECCEVEDGYQEDDDEVDGTDPDEWALQLLEHLGAKEPEILDELLTCSDAEAKDMIGAICR